MSGRIIVVGDVHGCATELEMLVAGIAPREGDRFLAVGDFTSKGANVAGALRFWRELGGESVLGNNDAKFLELLAAGAPSDDHDPSDRELAGQTDLVEWMRTWPLLIDVPDAGFCVVHGGLLPDRSLEENARDSRVLLELRHIRRDAEGWRPVFDEPEPQDPFWANVWQGERIVLYGHTPQRDGRPAIDERAVCLDTGCIYGAALTAMVIEDPTARGSVGSLLASGAWRIEAVAGGAAESG